MDDKKTFEQVLDEQGYLLYSNVGVSMRPLIREGRDLMIIESVRTRKPELYDAVLFRRPGVTGRGEYVLHRILRVNPDGTFWIAGDNTVSGETVRPENVLGVLTSVKRGFYKKSVLPILSKESEEIKLDDPRYQLYVKYWCRPYRLRFAIKKTVSLPRRVAGKMWHLIVDKIGDYK